MAQLISSSFLLVSNYPDFATILNKTGQIEGIIFVKAGYFVSQRAIIEIEKNQLIAGRLYCWGWV